MVWVLQSRSKCSFLDNQGSTSVFSQKVILSYTTSKLSCLEGNIALYALEKITVQYLGSTGRGVSSGVMYCLAKSAPRNRISLVLHSRRVSKLRQIGRKQCKKYRYRYNKKQKRKRDSDTIKVGKTFNHIRRCLRSQWKTFFLIIFSN